jgi:hypothetical protein
MVWVNGSGQLTDAAGLAFSRRDAGPKLTSGKWSVVAVVVDCLDGGNMTVFVDGAECVLGTAGASADASPAAAGGASVSALDGNMSIGQQVSLFGSKGKAANSKSAAMKCLSLYARCLHQSEIAGLSDLLRSEAKQEAVETITQHLQAMGVDYTIAQWAANAAEGDTIEQRINSALNMVYN